VPEFDLVDPARPILPTFGVAGAVLLFDVSDKPDLFKKPKSQKLHVTRVSISMT